jgi:hypothetical protein
MLTYLWKLFKRLFRSASAINIVDKPKPPDPISPATEIRVEQEFTFRNNLLNSLELFDDSYQFVSSNNIDASDVYRPKEFSEEQFPRSEYPIDLEAHEKFEDDVDSIRDKAIKELNLEGKITNAAYIIGVDSHKQDGTIGEMVITKLTSSDKESDLLDKTTDDV